MLITYKSVMRICQLLVVAIIAVWGASGCSCPSSGKMEETLSLGTNRYSSFVDYRAAGTTKTVEEGKIREKSPYDGKTKFVIYGVDVTSPQFKEWDFIVACDLSSSNLPDSYFDGYSMPLTQSVIALRKEVIRHLATSATKFVIDGNEVNEEEFNHLPGENIQRVLLTNDTIEIATRLWPGEEDNPEVMIAVDNEARLMRNTFKEEALAD